jgi:hypothetical protein
MIPHKNSSDSTALSDKGLQFHGKRYQPLRAEVTNDEMAPEPSSSEGAGGGRGRRCNLYSMTRNREAITRLFRIRHNRANAVEPLQSIFPGYQAPVVRRAADGERELVVLNRGFVLL